MCVCELVYVSELTCLAIDVYILYINIYIRMYVFVYFMSEYVCMDACMDERKRPTSTILYICMGIRCLCIARALFPSAL